MACRARAAAVPVWAMYWLLERQCRGSGCQLPEGLDSPGDGPPSDFRLIDSGWFAILVTPDVAGVQPKHALRLKTPASS